MPKMSSLHPTRRDLVLILSVVGVLLLFMQFDLSFKSDLSVGFGSRRADDDGWETAREPAGRPAGAKGKWLTSVETGVQVAKMDAIAGMADAKVRWGEEGAVRTEVLAHAPGELAWDRRRDGGLTTQVGPSLTRSTSTTAHGILSRTTRRPSPCCGS